MMEEQAPQTNTQTTPEFQTRAIAFLIDSVIAYAISLIPVIGGLIGGAYMLLRDGLTLDFANGRSIGKHLMKIKPVRVDGKPMDIATSISRNWMFALGLLISTLAFIPIVGWILIPVVVIIAIVAIIAEIYTTYKNPYGRRYGDRFAGTRVIVANDEQ